MFSPSALKSCLVFVTFSSLFAFASAQNSTSRCSANDYKFEFTECDALGGRWRVSVPINPFKCSGVSAPTNPVRVNSCYSFCSSGEFYNLNTLLCEDCPNGHFSLGSAVVIDNFNVSNGLPRGFHIITESTKNRHRQRTDIQPSTETDDRRNCPGWSVDKTSKQLLISFGSGADSRTPIQRGGCISAVTYTARVVKPGRLRFAYRYLVSGELSASLLFTFNYKLYGEGTVLEDDREPGTIRFPAPSLDQSFDSIEVQLDRPGLYVFTWKAVIIRNSYRRDFVGTFDASQTSSTLFASNRIVESIQIKKIFIEGVAYTSECTPCEPGFFSNSSGSKDCAPCPENTFSMSYGASMCQSCDSITEYSNPGSSSCKKRPLCGINDIYSVPTSVCDSKTKKLSVEYKWIEPKICIDTKNVIGRQPATISCEDNEAWKNSTNYHRKFCDPGMSYREWGSSGTKYCQLCPSDFHSSGDSDTCTPCPPFTTPVYAISIHKWNASLPGFSFSTADVGKISSESSFLTSFFSRQCITPDLNDAGVGECDERGSWQPFDDYIRTGASAPLNSYLILSITINGFRSRLGGELDFSFETFCDLDDQCSLLFVETRTEDIGDSTQEFSSVNTQQRKQQNLLSSQNNIVNEWIDSSTGMKTFRYRIVGNLSVSYSFVFKRTKSYQSYAKLYSLFVTNVLGASAIDCQQCPYTEQSRCLTCPANQYLQASSNQSSSSGNVSHGGDKEDAYICQDCPRGTVLSPEVVPPLGLSSCHSCGENLVSTTKDGCYSDCRASFRNGDMFDLSTLATPLTYHGSNLFTAGGTQYLHLFKLSLCGVSNGPQLATCINNITDDSSGVRSFICRSTLIPEGSQVYSTQAISLGDELLGISRSSLYKNVTVHPEFLKPGSSQTDYHLYYATKTTTSACTLGRRLTVTMRCNPEVEKKNPGGAILSTPPSCPDGTCDGCNFHILIESGTAAACRLCSDFSPLDFEVVPGECIDGRQIVHFINPQNCVPRNGSIAFKTQNCSVELPRQVQVGIALSVVIAIVLLFLVLHFWNRNRSLEYKYIKLIENTGKSNDDDDEMTIDNCCAEEEDPDDEDVHSSHLPATSFSNCLFDDKRQNGNSPSKQQQQQQFNNNRARNHRKMMLGTEKEIQELFGSDNDRLDEEGYETIHLTSTHGAQMA